MAKSCPLLGTAIYLDCLDCDDKVCRTKQNYKYEKVVIGIDQSYQTTSVCIVADGVKKKLRPINLSKEKSNSIKRRVLRQELDSLLKAVYPKAKEVVCIIERIRLHSGGFLNINYIKSIGALNSIIIDECDRYGVEVFSVDTRAWKAQVVGTSKPLANKYGVPEAKWPTVKWCINQGWEKDILIKVEGRKKKGTFIRDDIRYMYDNDTADSAGIAMFGFIGNPDNLKKEA